MNKQWTNRLTHQDRLEVRLATEKGMVTDFSIQYVAQVRGRWYSIVRFDTAHGGPHMDVSHADGSFDKQSFPYQYMDYRDAFNRAITEMNEKWPEFRRSFEGEFGNGEG